MNKYGAVRITLDGIIFHSLAEKNRYSELKILEKAGVIEGLTLQPKFTLLAPFKDRKGTKHRGIAYYADFKYFDREMNCIVVEDTKGMLTEVYKLKKKLFLSQYREVIFLET